MKDILKVGSIVVAGAVGLILLVVLIIWGLVYGSQWLDKNAWGKWEYRVSVDETYFYTNDYKLKDNCIAFVNNYGDKKKYCEKFRVGENYWHDNSPNWRTVICGTE